MSKNFSILRWFGHFFMSLWIYVQILLHYLRFWTYMLQMVYICPRNQDLLDIFLHFFCFMSKHLSKPQILDISCRKTSFMSKIREAQNRDVTCAAPFAGTSKASLFQSRRTRLYKYRQLSASTLPLPSPRPRKLCFLSHVEPSQVRVSG